METTAIITELYKIYNALNDHYFENMLPSVFINLKQGKHKNKSVYGTFTPNTWAKGSTDEEVSSDESHIHEISIAGEFLSRPFDQLCATMCHEMVHLYCEVNGIKDTSNNDVYHNNKFKLYAEECELNIDKAPTIGWSVTSPTEAFTAFVNTLDVDRSVFEYFRDTQFGESKPTQKKRWVCPKCGQQVSGKKTAMIGCWDCQVQMDFWDLSVEGMEEILQDNNDGLWEVNPNLFEVNE